MKDIIILHGALGSKKQFEQLQKQLKDYFCVHVLDFEGHGGHLSNRAFSIERFAENVLSYMKKNNLENPIVFGYSMGGYVALYLSTLDKYFQKIITLGTKFDWSAESAQKEAQMLNPDKIMEKVPKYAQYLELLHGKQWKEVVSSTKQMMLAMGQGNRLENIDFEQITTPVTIGWGSEDTMVTKEESAAVANLLPNADFQILAGVKHPIQMIENSVLKEFIISNDF